MEPFSKMRSNVISCLLAACLAIAPLEGQSARGLGIVIVEGNGAINNVGQPVPRAISVRVEDENKKPVPGATVAFTLPAQGASGTFANQSTDTTVTTDEQGLAVVRALRPNKSAGKMEIVVIASYQGQTARATVTQFNMLVQNAGHKSNGKLILILSLVGGAAAGGAFAATHKSGTAPAPTTTPGPVTIGITPGTGTVGGPQ
jgi:hypothetical protein